MSNGTYNSLINSQSKLNTLNTEKNMINLQEVYCKLKKCRLPKCRCWRNSPAHIASNPKSNTWAGLHCCHGVIPGHALFPAIYQGTHCFQQYQGMHCSQQYQGIRCSQLYQGMRCSQQYPGMHIVPSNTGMHSSQQHPGMHSSPSNTRACIVPSNKETVALLPLLHEGCRTRARVARGHL